jgi:hypothetical protein
MTVFVVANPITALLVARLLWIIELSCLHSIGAEIISQPVSSVIIDFNASSQPLSLSAALKLSVTTALVSP